MRGAWGHCTGDNRIRSRRRVAIFALLLATLAVLPSGRAAAAPDDVLLVDPGPPGPPRVVRVDPDFFDPTALAIEADGDVVAVNGNAAPSGAGFVIRIDPVSGARTTVSANGMPAGAPSFAGPVRLAVKADGDIVVVDQDAFADSEAGVIRVDPASGTRTTASSDSSPAQAPSFVEP